ncbi:MAG: hypothetical protein WA009_04940 [Phototrophicaceae bacterium]
MRSHSSGGLVIDRTIGYPVSDIMTPEDQLTCWCPDADNRDEVIRIALDEGYTFVPVRLGDNVTSIVRVRGLTRRKTAPPLTHEWLISADTPILRLIGLLVRNPERPFLVLRGSEIVGLVDTADLNNTKARASLYLLMAHFEAELVRLVRKQVGSETEDFGALLSRERLERLIEEQMEAKKRDVNLSLIHHLYLTDLTTIVARSKRLREVFGFTSRSKAEEQLSFTPIRNPLSHQNSPVVSKRSDIIDLNEAVDRLIHLSRQLTEFNQQATAHYSH